MLGIETEFEIDGINEDAVLCMWYGKQFAQLPAVQCSTPITRVAIERQVKALLEPIGDA